MTPSLRSAPCPPSIFHFLFPLSVLLSLSPFPPPVLSVPVSLSLLAEYLNFADSTLPTRCSPEERRARVERGQYLYWTRERAGESSRGISSGNLQGPDVAKTRETDVPRRRRLSSRPRDGMPEEEGDEEERGTDVAGTSSTSRGWVGEKAKGVGRGRCRR